MQHPKTKPDHAPYHYADDTRVFRIGGEIYGTAAEIDDPHGHVWAALELMDGTRSTAAIVDCLVDRFPALTDGRAAGLVDALLRSGYVGQEPEEIPETLTPGDRERYARNHAFFRRVDLRPGVNGWHAQAALKRARVVVLGVGGAGSHAAWALAASGVGALHCVDPDVVEVTNLTRQVLYTESDLGRPKVEALAERLRQVNSGVAVTTEQRMVDAEAELAALIGGADALALCADRSRGEYIKRVADGACAVAGIPWVGGGYSGPFISIGVHGPGGACDACLVAGEEAHRRPGPVGHIGGPGVIASSAGICGNWIAYEVISQLTGAARQPPGYVRGINLIAPDQLVNIRHPPRPDCELCGPGRQP